METTLKGLLEERTELLQKQHQLLADADRRDGKRLSSDDEQTFDRIDAELEKLTADIDRRKKLDERDKATLVNRYDDRPSHGELTADDQNRAFRAWCRVGSKVPTNDGDLHLAQRCGFNPSSNEIEIRDMGVGQSGAGAKAVPKGFVDSLEVARLAYGSVRSVAKVVTTDRGNDLPFPTANDTGNSGVLLAEAAAVSTQDIAISEVVLQAFKYSSKEILVSVELLQDEAVNLAEYIGSALGDRLGRITNLHFTTGDASSKPNGIVTAATSGVTAASATAITYAELVNLQHSVDPAYQERSTWMFNFTVLGTLKKMVDSDGRPLWQPSAGAGMGTDFPATLLGRPYVVNQQMPAMTTGLKPILYGDCSKYIVRECKGITLLRLNERYADTHQVAFLAFMRTDGDLLDAATHPVKVVTMA